MINYKTKYDHSVKRIMCSTYIEVLEMANQMGANIVTDNLPANAVDFSITLESGEVYEDVASVHNPYALLEKLNELFDLKIDMSKSVFIAYTNDWHVFFTETPKFTKPKKEEPKIERKGKEEEEVAETASGNRPEEEQEDLQTEEVSECGDGVEEPEFEDGDLTEGWEDRPPTKEPDWKFIITKNSWSKNQLFDYAQDSFNITLNKKLTFAKMKKQFQLEWNKNYSVS